MPLKQVKQTTLSETCQKLGLLMSHNSGYTHRHAQRGPPVQLEQPAHRRHPHRGQPYDHLQRGPPAQLEQPAQRIHPHRGHAHDHLQPVYFGPPVQRVLLVHQEHPFLPQSPQDRVAPNEFFSFSNTYNHFKMYGLDMPDWAIEGLVHFEYCIKWVRYHNSMIRTGVITEEQVTRPWRFQYAKRCSAPEIMSRRNWKKQRALDDVCDRSRAKIARAHIEQLHDLLEHVPKDDAIVQDALSILRDTLANAEKKRKHEFKSSENVSKWEVLAINEMLAIQQYKIDLSALLKTLRFPTPEIEEHVHSCLRSMQETDTCAETEYLQAKKQLSTIVNNSVLDLSFLEAFAGCTSKTSPTGRASITPRILCQVTKISEDLCKIFLENLPKTEHPEMDYDECQRMIQEQTDAIGLQELWLNKSDEADEFPMTTQPNSVSIVDQMGMMVV